MIGPFRVVGRCGNCCTETCCGMKLRWLLISPLGALVILFVSGNSEPVLHLHWSCDAPASHCTFLISVAGRCILLHLLSLIEYHDDSFWTVYHHDCQNWTPHGSSQRFQLHFALAFYVSVRLVVYVWFLKQQLCSVVYWVLPKRCWKRWTFDGLTLEAICFLFGSQPFAISPCRLCSSVKLKCQTLLVSTVVLWVCYTCDQAPLSGVEVRQRALVGLLLLLFVASVHRVGLVLFPTQWLWTSRVAWVEPWSLTLFWFCLTWLWLFSLVNGYLVYGCTMTLKCC